MRCRTVALALSAVALSASVTTAAQGSGGIESPDSGVVQVGRGGAWLVRADDPLAAYFNPAALVTQAQGVSAGVQLMFLSHCYDRRDEQGERPSPGQGLAPAPAAVCADTKPFPNPTLAASFRLHQRFALGFALLTPHAVGTQSWPETIVYADRFGDTEHPSPQRYQLLESHNIVLWPTLSASVAATRELSFGAGFVWGVASIDMANMTEALSAPAGARAQDDFTRDVRAHITGVDGFVPGLVLSALWSPLASFSMAGWFRWSDAIRTSVDLVTQSGYYTSGGRVNDAGINLPENITDAPAAGELRIPIPMEAKLGLRYRLPRREAMSQQWARAFGGWVRDPLSTEQFDLELDLTWANNSAMDAAELRFASGIPIRPTTGMVPENADVLYGWRDSLGVRLGSDVVVLPDLLGLRAGAFFESSSANASYLNITFHPAEKVGLAGGATVRLGPVDIALAYQHTFFGAIDNGGHGLAHAISGDLTSGQRSRQTINGGSTTASLNELALGAAAHF